MDRYDNHPNYIHFHRNGYDIQCKCTCRAENFTGELFVKGVDSRNLDIYRMPAVEKKTIRQLAERYRLSEITVWNICTEIRNLHPSLLEKSRFDHLFIHTWEYIYISSSCFIKRALFQGVFEFAPATALKNETGQSRGMEIQRVFTIGKTTWGCSLCYRLSEEGV